MQEVIGVRLTGTGQLTYFKPGPDQFRLDDGVICPTDRGLAFGKVTISNLSLPEELLPAELLEVVRKADKRDRAILEENKELAQEALAFCQERVAEEGLDMGLVRAEYLYDRTKLIFYFTAEHRVDFRKLVRELAQRFHTRIELRQIGVRDQAKLLGGLGPCGQELCCRRFLRDFEPVSIKMAKSQGLSLNPTKISGLCGRLMCCLNYEEEMYRANSRRVPLLGTLVLTAEGQGHVVDRDILQTRIRVHLYKSDGSEEEKYFDVDDIEILEKRRKGQNKPGLWDHLEDHTFVSEGEKRAAQEAAEAERRAAEIRSGLEEEEEDLEEGVVAAPSDGEEAVIEEEDLKETIQALQEVLEPEDQEEPAQPAERRPEAMEVGPAPCGKGPCACPRRLATASGEEPSILVASADGRPAEGQPQQSFQEPYAIKGRVKPKKRGMGRRRKRRR